MKKEKSSKYIIMWIIISLLFTFHNIVVYGSESYFEDEKVEPKIILIDPGHGGMDGGAISKKGTVEKNINLKISLKLKDKLRSDGFTVLLTREEDKGLYSEGGTIRKKKNEDLTNRWKMKQESNCDLFISIHLNMFPESQYYGAQVWYSKNEESKKLATLMQADFKQNLDNRNKREAKPALDLYKILRGDNIPSVIVECGFLSNPFEEEKLKDEEYQEKIANSIVNSIHSYYNQQ